MKPGAKILFVDDEPAAIQLLRKTLSGIGELRFATGGQAALDLVARYGGEEFAVLLAGSSPAEALALAETVRLPVRADRPLHAAKAGGRNRVEVVP